VVAWTLGTLMVVSTMMDRSSLVIAIAIVIGLGWPHVALLTGRTADDQRAAGYRHLLIDGFLQGVFIGLTAYSPLPAGSIAVVGLGFQLMMVGPRQVVRGGLAMLAGMAVTLPIVGFHPEYVPSLLTINLCLVFFAGVFASAAYNVNRTTRDLVDTRQGLREANRTMADQARQLELAVAESIEINEVARTVNAALDLDDVLERVLQSLRKVFEFDQAGTLMVDRDAGALVLDRFVGPGATGEIEGRLRSAAIPLSSKGSLFVRALGFDAPACTPDISQETASFMAPADHEFWQRNPMRSIVMCPLVIRDEVIGLLCLGSRSKQCHLSERDLLIVERYVTHVATAIWSARLFQEAQRARRLAERELEIGREIQAEFLPERLPDLDGWQVAARLRSARQVSGDFYDAFHLPGGRVAVVVADVCDKGVGAALYMALFRSLMRAAADGAGDRELPFASAALQLANDYIAETHDRSNMFATVFAAAFDPSTGEMEYANGGHEPPAILRAGGHIERLQPTAPAVGLVAGSRFDIRVVNLEPGDTLFAFTDGVTEARAPDGALYEEQRLLEVITSEDESVEATLDRIETDVDRHAAGEPRADDMTLLVLRREPRSVGDTGDLQEGVA
jgi:serine phosphatase RsbU (regulator of sigma subunit)